MGFVPTGRGSEVIWFLMALLCFAPSLPIFKTTLTVLGCYATHNSNGSCTNRKYNRPDDCVMCIRSHFGSWLMLSKCCRVTKTSPVILPLPVFQVWAEPGKILRVSECWRAPLDISENDLDHNTCQGRGGVDFGGGYSRVRGALCTTKNLLVEPCAPGPTNYLIG